MPKPRSRRRAQTSIYETVREDPALEAALRSRQEMKDALSTAQHNFKLKDDAAQALITKLELGDGAAVRVGEFVITQSRLEPKHVEFERSASTRVRIKRIQD